MLPAKYRLRSSKEIQTVLKRGFCCSGKSLRVCVSPSLSGYSRVACVVGKKVSALAVVRHRYQRLIREAARPFVSGAARKDPYDVVVLALPAIKDIEKLDDIAYEFNKLITRCLSGRKKS